MPNKPDNGEVFDGFVSGAQAVILGARGFCPAMTGDMTQSPLLRGRSPALPDFIDVCD
jgi:hypothetical protein